MFIGMICRKQSQVHFYYISNVIIPAKKALQLKFMINFLIIILVSFLLCVVIHLNWSCQINHLIHSIYVVLVAYCMKLRMFSVLFLDIEKKVDGNVIILICNIFLSMK